MAEAGRFWAVQFMNAIEAGEAPVCAENYVFELPRVPVAGDRIVITDVGQRTVAAVVFRLDLDMIEVYV